jgi:hypothetical protein
MLAGVGSGQPGGFLMITTRTTLFPTLAIALALALSACQNLPPSKSTSEQPTNTLLAATTLPVGGKAATLQAQAVLAAGVVTLNNPQSSSFDDTTARSRYVKTIFTVTNTGNTPLTNVTFYAINKAANNIGGSALNTIVNAQAQAISDGVTARLISPTHAMTNTMGVIGVDAAQADLQAFQTSEVTATQTAARTAGLMTNSDVVLGYGFVARNGNSRTIGAANCDQVATPGCNQGTITLAYRFPITGSSNEPASFNVTGVLTTETTTRVTRSAEEDYQQASDAVARANAVGATEVVLLGEEYVPATTAIQTAGKTRLQLAPVSTSAVINTGISSQSINRSTLPWSKRFVSTATTDNQGNPIGLYNNNIIKLDLSGVQVWSKPVGAPASTNASQIIVANNNEIYVMGFTSYSFPGFTNAGGSDVFVIKFDANGNKLWSTQSGTSLGDIPKALTLDNQGNVYVTGFRSVPTGPGDRGFLVKYNGSTGQQEWWSGFSATSVNPASIHYNGTSIYLTGDITTGIVACNNGGDILAASYDTAGNQLSYQRIGVRSKSNGQYYYVVNSLCNQNDGYAESHDRGLDIKFFNNEPYLLTISNLTQTLYPEFEVILKLNSLAVVDSYKAKNGGGASIAKLAVDGNSLYAVGQYKGSMPVVINGQNYNILNQGVYFDRNSQFYSDTYIRKYNTAGQLLLAKLFGRAGDEIFSDVSVNSFGELQIAGNAASDGATSSTYSESLVKFDAAGNKR